MWPILDSVVISGSLVFAVFFGNYSVCIMLWCVF